ncbi:hypothetical protein GCM10010123_33780 [Pilimelia anulata]|uniref:DUF427 domain-containing protein n=1 Tax=Pilimelia anulata TaxID=53371 RepID=A0A8J3FAI1_9ACTN|nr:DUF427 domain-containing protein [Pilimelia anulata]GGK01011.1 hypothetical protein GCM10010123_33780 [Pilimelia anulata]
MPKAVWNDVVVAESDDIVVLEGNKYFPRASVREDVLRPSEKHTVCLWKGRASYYSLELDGERAENAVVYYPEPKPDARTIADRVYFTRDIKILD